MNDVYDYLYGVELGKNHFKPNFLEKINSLKFFYIKCPSSNIVNIMISSSSFRPSILFLTFQQPSLARQVGRAPIFSVGSSAA